MTKFEEIMAKTKGHLKSLITKESTQEQISQISEADKSIDDLQKAYDEKNAECEDLKNRFIEAVKNTGFKVNGSSNSDDGTQEETKSLDEIMQEELDKVVKNKMKGA